MFCEAAEDKPEEQRRSDGDDRELAGRPVLRLGKADDEGMGTAEQRFEEISQIQRGGQRGF